MVPGNLPTQLETVYWARAASNRMCSMLVSIDLHSYCSCSQTAQWLLVSAAHLSSCCAHSIVLLHNQSSCCHCCCHDEDTHHADTLRKHPQQTAGVGEGLPQALSGHPQQEAFYPNRALADVYGDSLTSSKSEPHGQSFTPHPDPSLSFQTPVTLRTWPTQTVAAQS